MNGFFRNEYPLNSTLSDINGSELSTSGIMMDFSRAMGNFKVSCDNYRCNIIDYFDFEFDPDETPLENIAEATGMAFRGRYDEASVAIGRMYCQELDNEQPSKTSIPINIEISIR
ncbi:MAG: hypothetical protein H6844_19215 [Alphaproteobacteria bacterium]|nr:hypothetical protein [Alphaproteobacteria bacterium]